MNDRAAAPAFGESHDPANADSHVEPLAPAVRADGQLPPEQVEALVSQLRAQEGDRRRAVPAPLGTPETIVASLVNGARRRTRGRRILLAIYWTLAAVFTTAYIVSPARSNPIAALDLFLVLGTGAVLLHLWLYVRGVLSPARWIQADNDTDLLKDVRNVGHLAELLTARDAQVAKQAEIELTALLPRLREADAGLLTLEQRQRIYRELTVRNIKIKPDFLIAVLGCVERLGDDRALPEVMALANCRAEGAKGLLVKAAAESCLNTLQQTDQEKDARRSLLRASDGDSCSEGALLRASTGGIEPNKDELLRAQAVE